MQEWLTNELLEYAKVNAPHIGKSATSKEKVGKFANRPGEVAGEVRLARAWFGLGQEVCYDVYWGINPYLPP